MILFCFPTLPSCSDSGRKKRRRRRQSHLCSGRSLIFWAITSWRGWEMSERGEMICADRGDISKCIFPPHRIYYRIPLHFPRSAQRSVWWFTSAIINPSVIFHSIWLGSLSLSESKRTTLSSANNISETNRALVVPRTRTWKTMTLTPTTLGSNPFETKVWGRRRSCPLTHLPTVQFSMPTFAPLPHKAPLHF